MYRKCFDARIFELSQSQAEIGLKNFAECISDCKKVLQLDQENRDAKLLLRQAVSGQKEADKKSKAVFASILAQSPPFLTLSCAQRIYCKPIQIQI